MPEKDDLRRRCQRSTDHSRLKDRFKRVGCRVLPCPGCHGKGKRTFEKPVLSVWRTNRTPAAAKVEALTINGMDEIEIPAFLRRQVD